MEHSFTFIKNAKDLFRKDVNTNILQDKIHFVPTNGAGCLMQQPALIYLNAYTTILVLSGTASLNINYKRYNIESDSLILLSPSKLFSIEYCSSDFRCESLSISGEYVEEINCNETTNIIKNHFGENSLPTIISLSGESKSMIQDHFRTINNNLTNTNHLYFAQVVYNRVVAYFLDLADIVEVNKESIVDYTMTRYEQLTSLFMELLTKHYRSEHNVDFYAEKLHITPHYLTLVLKQTSNLSANELIFEMLYSEARLLLKRPKTSIQDVANRLNFSDQSSFGKFFKRKSGMSPIEYKKL